MKFLAKEQLVKRSPTDDCINLYYHPVYGMFYRNRLRMAASLLHGRKYRNILEIGYGSGIFMPELNGYGRELSGIDVHDLHGEIKQILKQEGINAELKYGDIKNIPFPDGSFECIVAMSVLEHVTDKDMDIVIGEIGRVLEKGGILVAGFPTHNAISSCLFSIAGFNPEVMQEIHPSDHNRIISAISKKMEIQKIKQTPSFVPRDLGLYNVVKAISR